MDTGIGAGKVRKGPDLAQAPGGPLMIFFDLDTAPADGLKILRIHSRGMPLDADVDLPWLTRLTAGRRREAR